MKQIGAFVSLILLGGLGIALFNGYFIPTLITGTSTGDVITTILFPVGFAVAIMVAILVALFGINRRKQQ